jgi:hypothetical protein
LGEDRYGYGRRYPPDALCVLCGGRVAEEQESEETAAEPS